MPEPASRGRQPPGDARPTRAPADHAAIDRLTDDLLPALIAKLGATGPRRARGPRGRLARPAPPPGRRPAAATTRGRDRAAARAGAGRPRRPPTGRASRRPRRRGRAVRPRRTRDGAATARPATAGSWRPRRPSASSSRAPSRAPATRVRAGDRLGSVDMLGRPAGGRRAGRTASSAPASSRPATPSSTARSWSVIEFASAPRARRRPDRVPQGPHRQPRRDRAADPARVPRRWASRPSSPTARPIATRCRSSSPTRRSASARPTRARSYLSAPAVISAALVTGCDAIHPGLRLPVRGRGLRRGRRARTT